MLSLLGSSAGQGGFEKFIHFDWDTSITYDKAIGADWYLAGSGVSLTTGKFGKGLNLEANPGGSLNKTRIKNVGNLDFTIEYWTKSVAYGYGANIDRGILSVTTKSYADIFDIKYNEISEKVTFKVGNVSIQAPLPTNAAWHYVKMGRKGDNLFIRIDGGSLVTASGASSINNMETYYLGGLASLNTPGPIMDELRVIFGVGDDSAVVPTSPF